MLFDTWFLIVAFGCHDVLSLALSRFLLQFIYGVIDFNKFGVIVSARRTTCRSYMYILIRLVAVPEDIYCFYNMYGPQKQASF